LLFTASIESKSLPDSDIITPPPAWKKVRQAAIRPSVCLSHSLGGCSVCPRPTAVSGGHIVSLHDSLFLVHQPLRLCSFGVRVLILVFSSSLIWHFVQERRWTAGEPRDPEPLLAMTCDLFRNLLRKYRSRGSPVYSLPDCSGLLLVFDEKCVVCF